MQKSLVILLVLFFNFSVFGQSDAANFEPDAQAWNDTQFIVPLDKEKQWNAIVWVFGRFGDKIRTTTDARIGGLITKRANKYLTVGGGYLYRYANPTFRRGLYESRYLGLATATIPLGNKFVLVNRNLYQYENRYSRPDSTILRSRFWVRREVTVAKKKIEPFVAFEQFYDLRADAFVRDRIQVGFSRRFNQRYSGDFFFVRQNEGGNGTRPGSLNGIGSSLRINF